MNTNAFSQVDHPLIVIAQSVVAIYTFRLFFAVRRAAQPLPQIVAMLAFGVLANLAARVGGSSWFWIADIVQYISWAGAVIAAVSLVRHRNAEARTAPNAPVVRLDFFDYIEVKAVWAFSLIVAGVLTVSYVQTYQQKQTAQAGAIVAATVAKTQATTELTQQLCETKETQDSLLAAVTSISATQGTILANQAINSAKILKSNEDVKKQVSKQTTTVKKTLQNSVIQARPLEPVKPKVESAPDEKPGFWKRFFGNKSARLDSTFVRGDSLVYQ